MTVCYSECDKFIIAGNKQASYFHLLSYVTWKELISKILARKLHGLRGGREGEEEEEEISIEKKIRTYESCL